jgi:uncharacterized membrane protein YoaK (UPF0700 family)
MRYFSEGRIPAIFFMRKISLLLTLAAAFTDSATFVGADKLFSAHVTGNFIVLAYDIIHGADANEWSKLLAFPVFFVAVMIAGRQSDTRPGQRGAAGPTGGSEGEGNRLLRIEGMLLVLAGLAAAGMRWGHIGQGWMLVPVSMVIVVAMAFQNAFGRLYSKRIYGPTTVMTGNVTSAALDIAALLLDKPRQPEKYVPLWHSLAMILVFLVGCFAGGACAYFFGLVAVVVPGVVVLGMVGARGRSDG